MCVKGRGRVCVCEREVNTLHWANCSFQLSAFFLKERGFGESIGNSLILMHI